MLINKKDYKKYHLFGFIPKFSGLFDDMLRLGRSSLGLQTLVKFGPLVLGNISKLSYTLPYFIFSKIWDLINSDFPITDVDEDHCDDKTGW